MQQLSAAITKEIDKVLAKFPGDKRQSAVISALMLVQNRNQGYLTPELMDLVAAYIGMPKIAVYEVFVRLAFDWSRCGLDVVLLRESQCYSHVRDRSRVLGRRNHHPESFVKKVFQPNILIFVPVHDQW